MKVSPRRVSTLTLCMFLAGLLGPSSILAQRVAGLTAEQTHREKLKTNRLQEGAQAMVNMPSVAPLFIEDARFTSTLYVVNEGNTPAVSRLLLLTQDGRVIGDKSVSIAGHDKAEVAIKPLLEKAKSTATRGSVELFDDNVAGSALAGELVITYQGQSASTNLDEELLMPTMSQSHELRGLAIRAVANPVVSISSTSDQPVQVKVACTGERSKPTQVSFQILSHQIVTIRPCSNSSTPVDASNAFNYSDADFGPPEAKGIQILSPDPKAEIQAFGFSPIMTGGELSFVPISFHDPDDSVSNQAVFPGVPVGFTGELWGTYHPRLVAQNYSATARTISVYDARTVSGSSPSYGIEGKLVLQPYSVMTTDIDPGDSATDAVNTFVVESDGQPDDVQIQLWSEDVQRKSPILFAGKDAKDDRNAGMHPWSATAGSQDDLILYNETEADQPVNLTIGNRQTIWAKTVTLAAHETRRISPRQLADAKETGDGKAAFNLGAGEGEISWYANESGNVRGRLQHVDTHAHRVTSFQCAGYVVFCGIAPISGPATVGMSQSATFSSGNPQSCVNNEAPQLCYGVQNGSWNSVTWQWTDFSPQLSGSSSSSSISLTGSQMGQADILVEAIPYASDCDFTEFTTTQVTAACFAQLKYRAVEILGVEVGNHSFWWHQDSSAQSWVDDAGPTGNCLPNCGYLNSWGIPGYVGHYSQDDARTTSVAWKTAVSASVCQSEHNLVEFEVNWRQNYTGYAIGKAPNSNTWAHEAGNAAPYVITTPPPNAPGW